MFKLFQNKKPRNIAPTDPNQLHSTVLQTNSSKKLNKKFIALISIIVVVSLLLVTVFLMLNKPKPVVVTKEPEPVTIVIWSFSETAEHYDKLLKEYTTENPLVTIKFEQRDIADYKKILEQRLIENPAGVADIIELDNKDISYYASFLAPAPTDVYTADEFISSYYLQPQNDNIIGGSVYGIPQSTDGLVLVYNSTLVKRSDIPIYWPEFIKYATSKTQADENDLLKNKINGIAIAPSDKTLYLGELAQLLIFQNRGFLDTGSTSVQLSPKSSVDALNLYNKIVEKRPWDQVAINSVEAFGAGNTAFAIVKSSDLHYLKTNFPTLTFGTAPMPIIAPQVYWSSYTSFAVNGQTKNATETWKLLKYLSSEKSMQYLYNTAAQFKLPQKPFALKSLVPSLQSNELLSPYNTMAPNMTNWMTPDKAQSDKIFLNHVSTEAEFGEEGIKGLNEQLLTIIPTFPGE